MSRPKTRSYTYRVPLDNSKAMRKILRLKSLNTGYHIVELADREVPNVNAQKNWAVKFYQSDEMRDFETGQITGGTIPGFHDYRHSLSWKPTPETNKLEMRNANNGGTKIRGHQFVGTHDPRLPDNVPVDFTVPWTPTEIKAMFDGQEVPDRMNYGHDPPMIEAKEARQQYREEIKWAKEDGLEELREKLHQYMKDCDHNHVVETEREHGEVAFCEDCGRDWHVQGELEDSRATVVGTV